MGIERLQNKRQDKLFLSESYGSERQLKKRARTCRGMRHFTILKMQTEKTKSECIKRLHTDLENICMLEQKEKKKCAHPAGHTLYQGCHYLLSYKYVLFTIKFYTKFKNTFKLKINDFQRQSSTHIVSWSCPLVKRDTQKSHSNWKNNIDQLILICKKFSHHEKLHYLVEKSIWIFNSFNTEKFQCKHSVLHLTGFSLSFRLFSPSQHFQQ